MRSKMTQNKPKMFTLTIRSVMTGIFVFALLVAVDQLSGHFGLTGVERLGDNLLGGIIVGAVSFLDERRRNRYLGERLRIIALMNHHVRNSLQTIKFAHHTDRQLDLINEAAARIEWALREILPGDTLETPGNPGSALLPASIKPGGTAASN